MKIQIFSHSVNVGENQKSYIEEKIGNLSKYEERVADEATSVRVDIEYSANKTDGDKISTQITMYVPNAVIRAEVKGVTVEETIDLAVDKLKRQIERYKTKKHRRDKSGKWIPESTLESLSGNSLSQEEIEQIVKRKKYDNLNPMKEQEAIEQMELLGHDFYAFVNDDTDLFTVVYKRQDGDYGLIELEKKEY